MAGELKTDKADADAIKKDGTVLKTMEEEKYKAMEEANKIAVEEEVSGIQRDTLIQEQILGVYDYIAGFVIQFILMTLIIVGFYDYVIAPVEFTPSGLFTTNTAIAIWFNIGALATVSLVCKFLRRKGKNKWQKIQDKLDSESDGNNKNDSRRMIRARRDTLLRKYFITAFELILNTILYAIFMVCIVIGGWCFCYPSFPSNIPLVIAGILISIVFMLVATSIYIFLKKRFNRKFQEIDNKLDSISSAVSSYPCRQSSSQP